MLPECTDNTDPNQTAENQNSYFVNKVQSLVKSLSYSNNPKNDHGWTPPLVTSPPGDSQPNMKATNNLGKTHLHTAVVPSHSKLIIMALLALTTSLYFVALMVCLNQYLHKKKKSLNHWISDIKHFECNICEKTFEVKPLDCDSCGTSF